MRFFVAFTIAALLGCTANQPAAAQTAYDAQQDARIKALEDKVFGTTTGGTTTGGTTTGGTTSGTTTGGTTTGGTTTGGTTTGGTTTGGTPTYRTIFAQTDVNQSLLGWERCGNQEFHSGGSITVLNNAAAAHSGSYFLQAYRPTGTNTAMRLFQLREYGANCQQSNLPNETKVTFMVKIPQNYSNSFLIIGGWKQNQKDFGGNINDPTNCIEFFGSIAGGLRANLKGMNSGTVNGSPSNQYVYGTNLANRNERHNRGFPINQWVRIDYHVKHSIGNDGYFRVYQDGVLILSYAGRTMRENAPRLEWELTNYGNGNATTIYFDTFVMATPQ